MLTARRSVIRGASDQPRRLAFSISARVGRRAAVRSAGAVRRSPYRCSAALHASRTRYRSFESRGQYRHDVDMVGAVPDRDPADGVVVLSDRCEAGPVHDVASDLRPLSIRQRPIFRSSTDRAVPHRPGKTTRAESGVRLLQ